MRVIRSTFGRPPCDHYFIGGLYDSKKQPEIENSADSDTEVLYIYFSSRCECNGRIGRLAEMRRSIAEIWLVSMVIYYLYLLSNLIDACCGCRSNGI